MAGEVGRCGSKNRAAINWRAVMAPVATWLTTDCPLGRHTGNGHGAEKHLNTAALAKAQPKKGEGVVSLRAPTELKSSTSKHFSMHGTLHAKVPALVIHQ